MMPRQRHVLFAVLLATAALAQEPAWTRVATIDVHRPDGGGFVEGAACYHYSAAEIPVAKLPADAAERDVLFGTNLRFRFAGTWPPGRYEVRVRFLSDSDARAVRLSGDATTAPNTVHLPAGEVLERRFPLTPSSRFSSFTVRCTAGPNAPVCGLEIWSDFESPLSPPPPLADQLRRIDEPWPRLSPRPQSVAGVESPRLLLDGTWRFRAAAPQQPVLEAAALSEWSPIEVPGEWTMQGFTVAAGQPAAYAREFDLPADWAWQELRLRFDSVHSVASVWLNDVRVGGHEGGFVPFELDVTKTARPGRNLLLVQVTSASLADTLASASQYAAHPLGGITRKVELFALPPLCAEQAVIDADFDAATNTCTLRADVALSGRGALRLQLRDAAGQVIAAQSSAIADGSVRLDLTASGALPWDPEHPRLYDLLVSVLGEHGVTETFTRQVGFRRVEVRGNRLFVNDRPVKLKGACRHEVHPLRGRSLTPALWRRDAELMREANCNYVRTSHYPPAEEFLDACDRLGLFVECEAALCWVQHGANAAWGELDSLDPALLPYLLGANQDNVAANRHHPSIILWSLANESRWSPLFAEVNARIKRADPTRPTSFHDQCWGDYNNARSEADIAVYHYPDENGPAKCDQETRPVLFGEYCHVECYNRRELVTDPGVRDDWGRGFARMYELMYAHDGCLGGAIWAAFDDVFCLPDGRTTGYGPWGCIADGWRRDKPESFHVKNAYAPLRVDVLATRREGDQWIVPIENRFDFTDLSEMRIEWQADGNTQRVPMALPPHARGQLQLPWSGGESRLTITGVDGRVWFATDEVPPPPPPDVPSSEGHWRLDGERIHAGEVGDKAVVVGGPDFMLLPLQNDKCEPVDLALAQPLNDVADSKVATGHFELHADGARLTVRYDFTATAAINPRQWGAVLWLARDCEQLAWRRDAQGALYPADHIGRQVGAATPRLLAAPQPYPRTDPQQPWSQDATLLGGHDFTATRTNLRELCLGAADGRGLRVRSDGTLAARAFVQGDRIGLLLAGFHTGGGDGFFAAHFAAERRPLQAGQHMTGECTIELIDR